MRKHQGHISYAPNASWTQMMLPAGSVNHAPVGGGQVMVQLVQPGPTGTYDQAITGGTGRFAGARGTVRVAQQPGGDRFTFKIRVGR